MPIPKSGPAGPHEPPDIRAQVMMRSGPAGPHEPGDGAIRMAAAGQGEPLLAASAAQAQMTAQQVALKVAIKDPRPFAVTISSPDPMRIEIQKVEVEIYSQKDRVFSTAISSACGLTIEDASRTQAFQLTPEELESVLPHLQVGNTAIVKVDYLAHAAGEIHISVVAYDHNVHSVEDLVNHVSERV